MRAWHSQPTSDFSGCEGSWDQCSVISSPEFLSSWILVYSIPPTTTAFICLCERKPLSHPASSFFFNSKWLLRCSLNEQHVDPATDCHLMWLQTPPTESEKPTLLQLYDLNVLEEVGTHYRILGTFLLRDHTGCIVDAIEQDSLRQTHTITMKILQRWLLGKGEPVTWDTLVKILHRCKLDTLADKIHQQYFS